MPKFVKLEEVLLKNHPELNEKWVQNVIAENPEILGLGNLQLKDKERIQPHAGRLDLLLQSDDDSNTRYEVEIQLGKTDESHIIRTIEYWDIERNLHPSYDHVAVIVAEDITSRFLNVISLFNKSIPLIAIQMKAVKIGDDVSLIFTRVLDLLPIGIEDEETNIEPTDRNYWENRSTKKMMGIVDALLEIVHTVAPEYQLNYNKYYIGLSKDGVSNNFVHFKPKKQWVGLLARTSQSEDLNSELESAAFEWKYEMKYGWYNLHLMHDDINKNRELLGRIVKMAYEK